jgi:hypothetical protein
LDSEPPEDQHGGRLTQQLAVDHHSVQNDHHSERFDIPSSNYLERQAVVCSRHSLTAFDLEDGVVMTPWPHSHVDGVAGPMS